MAFRIRRGTDTERLSIAPAEGELLYTTDTGNIYVGDGSTTGGNLVTTSLLDETSPELGANLDLGGNNIVGTGNINITGTITATGDINLGDGAEDNVIVGGQIQSSLIPSVDNTYNLGDQASAWKNGFFEGLNVDGEVNANSIRVNNLVDTDSTVIYNGDSGFLQVPLQNNLVNAVNDTVIDVFNSAAFFETVQADSLIGSLYAPDSGTVLDMDELILNVLDVQTESITTTNIVPSNNGLSILPEIDANVSINANSPANRTSTLRLASVDLEEDLTSTNYLYGRLLFERTDINGVVTTGIVGAGRDNMFFASSPTGNISPSDTENFMVLEDGNLVIGGGSPNHKLDVRGEAVIQSYVQFGSFTDTERNSLTPQNGMVIYNTTVDKFQGYQAGAWINLDDGTAV